MIWIFSAFCRFSEAIESTYATIPFQIINIQINEKGEIYNNFSTGSIILTLITNCVRVAAAVVYTYLVNKLEPLQLHTYYGSSFRMNAIHAIDDMVVNESWPKQKSKVFQSAMEEFFFQPKYDLANETTLHIRYKHRAKIRVLSSLRVGCSVLLSVYRRHSVECNNLTLLNFEAFNLFFFCFLHSSVFPVTISLNRTESVVCYVQVVPSH